MSMPWPEDLGSGTVLWDLGFMKADNDDSDRSPQLTAGTGITVNFSPDVSQAVRYNGVDGNKTIMPLLSQGIINEEGLLCTMKEDGTPDVVGVVLPATDSETMTPRDWTYTVTVLDNRIIINRFSISLATGAEIDLADFAPVDSSGGTHIVTEVETADRAEQARDEALTYRNDAQEAYEQFSWPVQVRETPPENTNVIWVNPDEPAGTASDYARRAEEMYEASQAIWDNPIDSVRYSAAPGKKLTTPTHEGSGEAAHPSVLHFSDGFAGYEYWMLMTPLPAGNDAHEDPDILVSHDGDTWVVPDGLQNPLDDAPGGSIGYNSDTCLVYAEGKLWAFWRYVSRENDNIETLYVRTSEDGVSWTPREVVLESTAANQLVSPEFIHEGDHWKLFVNFSGTARNELSVATSPDLSPGSWSAFEIITVDGIDVTNQSIWHHDLRKIGDQYVGTLATYDLTKSATIDLLMVASVGDSHTHFRASTFPVVPTVSEHHNSMYKASMIPVKGVGGWEFDLFYSASQSTPTPWKWHIYRTRLIPSNVEAERVHTARVIEDSFARNTRYHSGVRDVGHLLNANFRVDESGLHATLYRDGDRVYFSLRARVALDAAIIGQSQRTSTDILAIPIDFRPAPEFYYTGGLGTTSTHGYFGVSLNVARLDHRAFYDDGGTWSANQVISGHATWRTAGGTPSHGIPSLPYWEG